VATDAQELKQEVTLVIAICSAVGPLMRLPGITDQPECDEGAAGHFPSLNTNVDKGVIEGE